MSRTPRPDFERITRELYKLKPTLFSPLDRSFELMRAHMMDEGGDKHHGLMKSIWPEYQNLKKHPWNLVRLPPQVHAEVHVLMAAAFTRTDWFGKFNAAKVISVVGRGSKFDAPIWQKRIAKFTKDGKFYAGACDKEYKLTTGSMYQYAQRTGTPTASYSDVMKGRIRGSVFDSPAWQKRIKESTRGGILYVSECSRKGGGSRSDGRARSTGLTEYAHRRGIRTANNSESRIGKPTGSRLDSPVWQNRIKKHSVNGVLNLSTFIKEYRTRHKISYQTTADYARRRKIATTARGR